MQSLSLRYCIVFPWGNHRRVVAVHSGTVVFVDAETRKGNPRIKGSLEVKNELASSVNGSKAGLAGINDDMHALYICLADRNAHFKSEQLHVPINVCHSYASYSSSPQCMLL